MRKRKTIRGAFYTNGLSSDFTGGNITLSALTSDWYIYYILNTTDEFKIAPTGTTNATTSPIPVDTDTTGVTSSPSHWLSYTGDTQQITVTNEDGYNVTAECNFNSTDTAVATVSSSGLMSMVGTGNTYVYASHPDSVTGTTYVTGYTYETTSINITPTSVTLSGGTSTRYELTSLNQDGIDVTEEVLFTGPTDELVFNLSASGGTGSSEYGNNWVSDRNSATGSTSATITGTHKSGESDTVAVTWSWDG